MEKSRLDFIEKRLAEIPREESKLNQERNALRAELKNLSADEIESLAIPWNGKEEVTGRLVKIDYEAWKILIRETDFDFVVVDCYHLRSDRGTLALAKKLAEQFALRSFRYHPDHITVTPAGEVR